MACVMGVSHCVTPVPVISVKYIEDGSRLCDACSCQPALSHAGASPEVNCGRSHCEGTSQDDLPVRRGVGHKGDVGVHYG